MEDARSNPAAARWGAPTCCRTPEGPETESAQGGFLFLQAGWTASLRSRIYSLLPLRSAGEVVEVGCGTGAVLAELARLCRGRVTGIDCDPCALEAARRSAGEGVRLIRADAVSSPLPRADIFVFSHFLLHVTDLGRFLDRVAHALRPGGYTAVLSEYDWAGAAETPPTGLLCIIREALSGVGLALGNGAVLDEAFAGAGLARVASGVEPGEPAPPDAGFLGALLGERAAGVGPARLSVPVRWGVYRKRG